MTLKIPTVQMITNDMANLVCQHLPSGYEISIVLEKGAGSVHLSHIQKEVDYPYDETDDAQLTFDERIMLCLNTARSQEKLPLVEASVCLVDPVTFVASAVPVAGVLPAPAGYRFDNVRIDMGVVGVLAQHVQIQNYSVISSPFRSVISIERVIGPVRLVELLKRMLQEPHGTALLFRLGDKPVEFKGCRLDTISATCVCDDTAIAENLQFRSTTDFNDSV